MVLGKSVNAVSSHFEVGSRTQLQCLGDLLVARRRRQMMWAGRKLDVMHAHALQMPDRLGQFEVPQRIALHANRETAPPVLGVR